jgi:tetratricopeptide (TPR) repeat protein
LLATSLVLAPLPSFAGPPAEQPATEAAPEEAPIDTEARAMAAFNEGQAAYDRGDYQTALELFLEAQSLYSSPVFHYNIGRCYEALENYEQAITSYKAYLSGYKSATGSDPDDKVNIENGIARLEKQAEIARQERDKPVIIQAPDTPPPKRDNSRALLVTGGVLTGLGAGALIVGGAVFGSRAMTVSQQLDDVYSGNPDELTLADARALDEQGRMAELNQIILMSAGGALAITGIALIVVGAKKAKQAKAERAERQAGARFVPALAPGHAGFVLSGRF